MTLKTTTVALLVTALAVSTLGRVPLLSKDVEALQQEQTETLGEQPWEAQATPFVFEEIVKGILEKVRETMKTGDPENNVPVLDPFQMSHAGLHVNESLIKTDATLDSFVLTGLSGFNVTDLKISSKINGFNSKFTMNMPKVVALGVYNMTSLLGELVPLYGMGPLVITINNLKVNGTASVRMLPMKLNTLALDYELGEYYSHFSGLLGGGDFGKVVNEVINDLVPEIIMGNEDIISEAISSQLKKIINNILP